MTGGSQQLRRFRIAVRDGASVEAAAQEAGIAISEARLIAADDAKNPPPDEAFMLLGHNSSESQMSDNASTDMLRQYVERAERLIEERKGLNEDLKDVFGEAKSQGFDVPTLKWAIRQRAKERAKLQEEVALQETYGAQLGLF